MQRPTFDIKEYQGHRDSRPSRDWRACPYCGSTDSGCALSYPWMVLEPWDQAPGSYLIVAEGNDCEMRCLKCGAKWRAPGSATVYDPQWFESGGKK